MSVLLTTAYFPPIQYFAALTACAHRCSFSVSGGRAVAWIEACENYQKQSYRNRCHFYSASGMQALSFPVVHESGTHALPITRIRVDYSRPWFQQHKRAIVSAYRTSAFFDYYQDELFGILDRQPETLWELNMSITRFFLDKIGIPVELRPTETFLPVTSTAPDLPTDLLPAEGEGICDLRQFIHPKHPDNILDSLGLKKTYFQVFSRKYAFIPNLSIMDLLFNEGPNSISYLLPGIRI